MPNFEWKRDAQTGDHVLVIDGKERGRIPDPELATPSPGASAPGTPFMELDDLKREFEYMTGCVRCPR
jgi:hypothetical protein